MSPGRKPRGARAGGPPGGPRHVTEDEAKLWSLLATTTKPLKRAKTRVVPALEDLTPAKPARQAALPHPPGAATGRIRHPAKVTPTPGPAPAAKPPAPPIAAFERRIVRKVAGGRIEIDARLDLHGLKAEEARHRLRGFVLSCAARELRVVLVITGKGRTRDAGDNLMGGGDRGILRRMVPIWLAEHDLRPAVLSFTPAHTRHGGDGALYVRLRRKRR